MSRFWLGTLIVAILHVTAQGQAPCRLDVTAAAAPSSAGGEVLIVDIANPCAFAAESVRVVFQHDRSDAILFSPVVSNSYQRTISLRLAARASDYGVVYYRAAGAERSQIVPLQRQPLPTSSPLTAYWISGVMALLGVTVGAIVTHVLAARREREKMRLERLASARQRAASAATDFLTRWQLSRNVVLLRAEFERMQAAAVLPSQIVRRYTAALLELDRAANSNEAAARCEDLYEAIRNFCEDPMTNPD